MERQKKYLAYLIIALAFIIILMLHTGQNMKERLKPPSDKWSQAMTLGKASNGMPPFIEQNGNQLLVSYLNGSSLHVASLDRQFNMKEQHFALGGDAVTSYFKHGNQVVYRSGDHLYHTLIDQEKAKGADLLTEQPITAYSGIAESGGQAYIAASTNEQLLLYSLDGKEAVKLSEYDELPPSVDRTLLKLHADGSQLQMVLVTRPTEDALVYHYLTYDRAAKTWKKQKLHRVDFSSGTSRQVQTAVDFAIHQEKIEVFTAYQYRGQLGLFRKINHFLYNMADGELITPGMDLSVKTDYGTSVDSVNDLQVLGAERNGNVHVMVSAESRTGREEAQYRMVELSVKKGIVNQIQYASSPYTFAKYGRAIRTDSGDVAAWLEPSGTDESTVKVAGSSNAFNDHANQWNMDILLGSVYGVINALVLSIVTLFITCFWSVPALVVLPMLEGFRSRTWVEDNVMAIVSAAAIGTVLFEMIFFGRLFYKPDLLPYMPGWLNFTGALYVIPVLIGAVALVPTMLYRKGTELESPLALFTFFMLADLLLIDLLFAPYLV